MFSVMILQLFRKNKQLKMDINEKPIKRRIEDINQCLEQIRNDNNTNNKELILIEKEMKILESKLQDPFKVIKDYFQLSKETLKTGYEKQCYLYEEQSAFLHEQVSAMIDDKLKGMQNCLIMQEKLRNLEQDVGLD